MTCIAYTVHATFPDQATMDEWVAWLEDGHVDQVIAHGAHAATIVKFDREKPTDPLRAEVRYIFSTRENYDKYIREFASAMRADGLKRFSPERRIVFQRTVGVIV